MNMLMLSERDVAQLLSTADAVEILEAQLRLEDQGAAQSIPRQRARNGGYVLHVLPAATAGAYLGTKLYLSGGASTQFVYLLFGPTGLKALIAADHLGRIRTGAASGLATKYLARPDAKRLVVIGAGNQAFSQIEAVCAVRPIEHVTICNRNAERARQLAAIVRRHVSAEVEMSSDTSHAVAQADVICTITNAKEPVFEGADLPASVHINAAGSNRATHREIDRQTLDHAALIVADDIEQARREAGDFLLADAFDWTRVQPLSAILSLAAPPEHSITFFESLGIGLWDLGLAIALVQRAEERSFGTKIDLTGFFQAPHSLSEA